MKQNPRLLSRNSSSNYLVFARQLSRRFNFCHRRFQAPAPRRLPRVYRSYFSLGRPGLGGVTAAAALLRSDVHKHRRKTRSLPDKTAMAAGADGHRRDRPFPAAGSSPPLRQRSRGHPTPVLGVRRLLPPAPPPTRSPAAGTTRGSRTPPPRGPVPATRARRPRPPQEGAPPPLGGMPRPFIRLHTTPRHKATPLIWPRPRRFPLLRTRRPGPASPARSPGAPRRPGPGDWGPKTLEDRGLGGPGTEDWGPGAAKGRGRACVRPPPASPSRSPSPSCRRHRAALRRDVRKRRQGRGEAYARTERPRPPRSRGVMVSAAPARPLGPGPRPPSPAPLSLVPSAEPWSRGARRCRWRTPPSSPRAPCRTGTASGSATSTPRSPSE